MSLPIALALAPFLVAFHAGEKVPPGQRLPDFEFKTLLGGDGRTKLSEFRGQPVLIAWYSTVFAGMEAARIAVDLDGKHRADGLAVFLMTLKNQDATYMRALQMSELPGEQCRLLNSQNLPVAYDEELGPPPRMILVGVDGTLRYAATYQRPGEVKKLLKEELGKVEKGWGEDPLARKARALAYGEGKLGEARVLLEPALAAGGASEELTKLAAEIEARFETLARSVAHHLEQGEPRRAADAVRDLGVAGQGRADWTARISASVSLLESAESVREAGLEKKLDALLKPTLETRPKKGLDAKLRALADGEASGTKVGARAARLAEAVARVLGGL